MAFSTLGTVLPSYVGLVAALLLLPGCVPALSPTDDVTDRRVSFSFTYAVALGRDCFMMGDCGYRLVLSPDGVLRRFNDRDEETASATLSSEERSELLRQLESEGFFDLPERLPAVPEEEMPRGGRVVTLSFESVDGSRTHEVKAYTDAESALLGAALPIPEAFYVLDEEVRTYLLDLLRDE